MPLFVLGRHQNSLPLTTNFSRNVTEPSKEISYQVGDLCQCFTKLTGPLPIHHIIIRYPQLMVQMSFCDLSHTFHKQVTNVSQHVFVILLWGMLMSPLIQLGTAVYCLWLFVLADEFSFSLTQAKWNIVTVHKNACTSIESSSLTNQY